jgi:cobalt-zinc-cadmium efflux system protein
MAHKHEHFDDHGHGRIENATQWGFAIGVALNSAFVLIEFVCGLLAGSLALLADAGHNLSDVLGLLLAWGASRLARRRPSRRRTYGLRRSSIVAALLNALLLLLAVGAIGWEAVGRLLEPQPVAQMIVVVVAAIGVAINTLTALLLLRGHKDDLNVRGAFLHMAADAAVSLGVVIGAIVIGVTGWYWIDPALSLIIAAVIAISTWDLLWQALDLSLDAVPRGIDPEAVRAFFTGLPGVSEVHDLHIWGMSTTETALTVHLVKPGAEIDDDWLADICHQLHERFGIDHPTIQVETGQGERSCRLAPEDVV